MYLRCSRGFTCWMIKKNPKINHQEFKKMRTHPIAFRKSGIPFLLALIVVFSSCFTLQPRRYQKGWHIDLNHNRRCIAPAAQRVRTGPIETIPEAIPLSKVQLLPDSFPTAQFVRPYKHPGLPAEQSKHRSTKSTGQKSNAKPPELTHVAGKPWVITQTTTDSLPGPNPLKPKNDLQIFAYTVLGISLSAAAVVCSWLGIILAEMLLFILAFVLAVMGFLLIDRATDDLHKNKYPTITFPLLIKGLALAGYFLAMLALAVSGVFLWLFY